MAWWEIEVEVLAYVLLVCQTEMNETEKSMDSSVAQEPFFNPPKGKLRFGSTKKLKFVSSSNSCRIELDVDLDQSLLLQN